MIQLFVSQGHETYNKFIVSEREKQLFSMKGPRFKAERFHLYKFMLENMSDEHRFQTTYRLCQDVLNGIVEGGVTLGEESFCLLRVSFEFIVA